MGFSEFSFVFFMTGICTVVATVGYIVTYSAMGKKPELFTVKTYDNLGTSVFGNNVTNMNPENKYIRHLGRYTTDPMCFARILPSNPEKYFTKETLNKIRYTTNKDHKELNKRFDLDY